MNAAAPIRPEKENAGREIRARRAFLGKSRKDVEDDTNGVIYEKLLQRIEEGEKRLRSLRLTQANALLVALSWSPAEFENATGVNMPTAEPVPGSRPFNGTVQVPIYGSVSAGIRQTETDERPAGYMALDPSLPGVRGRDVTSLGVLTVNGDSMVSDRAAASVPQGSMVLVEWGALPRDEDLVVAWIDSESAAVLKQYREGDAVLRSFNPRGPVFRVEDEGVDVRGVVRLIFRKP